MVFLIFILLLMGIPMAIISMPVMKYMREHYGKGSTAGRTESPSR